MQGGSGRFSQEVVSGGRVRGSCREVVSGGGAAGRRLAALGPRRPRGEQAEGDPEGPLAGDGRGGAVGEDVDGRSGVAGGVQADDQSGDVTFERGQAVVGDEVCELVEVGLEPGAGWHQGDGGEGGGAHVDSVRHQG